MIWADRIALVWAIIVWGFIILTGQADHDKVGNVGLLLTLTPWIMMRALDFIFSGYVRSR